MKEREGKGLVGEKEGAQHHHPIIHRKVQGGGGGFDYGVVSVEKKLDARGVGLEGWPG